METFRCPTCIGVLTDARARRCHACGQGLRRRHPRVLGEEHRIGASTLPVDRWMLERLQGETPRRRRSRIAPPPWHGRFAPSPRSAEPDVARATADAPAAFAPPLGPTPEVADAALGLDTGLESTPAAVSALDLDVFVAPPPSVPAPPAPAPVDEIALAPRATPALPVAPAPLVTPKPIVGHRDLDPEVRALVDDLYEQARAELSGIDPVLASPPEPASTFAPIDEPAAAVETAAPAPPPVLDVELPPEATPTAPAPNPTRSGWVPAFVADEPPRPPLND